MKLDEKIKQTDMLLTAAHTMNSWRANTVSNNTVKMFEAMLAGLLLVQKHGFEACKVWYCTVDGIDWIGDKDNGNYWDRSLLYKAELCPTPTPAPMTKPWTHYSDIPRGAMFQKQGTSAWFPIQTVNGSLVKIDDKWWTFGDLHTTWRWSDDCVTFNICGVTW